MEEKDNDDDIKNRKRTVSKSPVGRKTIYRTSK